MTDRPTDPTDAITAERITQLRGEATHRKRDIAAYQAAHERDLERVKYAEEGRDAAETQRDAAIKLLQLIETEVMEPLIEFEEEDDTARADSILEYAVSHAQSIDVPAALAALREEQ